MSGPLDTLLARPLIETMFRRRTHRASRGVKLIKAGMNESSQAPAPLSALEEAMLIAATGHTGLTMRDRPFQDPTTGNVRETHSAYPFVNARPVHAVPPFPEVNLTGQDFSPYIAKIKIPAVLLTGYAGDSATLAVGGAITGSFSLLRKPIRINELADRIQALLSTRKNVA